MWGTMKAVFLLAALAQPVWAGEVLKLPSGNIDPVQIQKNVSTVYASSSKRTEWIIQFKNIITSQDKKSLLDAGAEVFGSLPDDALVVRTDYQTLKKFTDAHAGVNAFVPYAGSYKVSSDIGVTNLFNKDKITAFVVKTFKAQEAAQIAEEIQKLDSEVTLQSLHGCKITVVLPRNLIPMVAAMTGVERIRPPILPDSSDASIAFSP